MGGIGDIKGLPDLVPGLTLIRGATVECASNLAALTYGISHVLNKNIVAIDGTQKQLNEAEFVMARAYMQETGSLLPFPIDRSDVEDEWFNMVHVYGATRLLHISSSDFGCVDIVIRIPDSIEEAMQLGNNLDTIHGMYESNDICGILCLPFESCTLQNSLKFPIIDFYNDKYKIAISLPDGTRRDIAVSYTNGCIRNRES